MSDTKMIVLKSSDGETFEIEEAVALQLQTISHKIKDDCVKDEILISNITGEILFKVIEYCKKHVEGGGSVEELKIWDKEFIENFDQSKLIDLCLAAYYLNIKSLYYLTCQGVADMIKVKTLDEVRTLFNVENDYTSEEEAKILEENL